MINLKNQTKGLHDTLNTSHQYITENIMNSIHTTIHSHLTTLNNAIDGVLEKISLSMNTMQTEVQSAIEALKDEYERNSISPWTQQD